METVEVVVKIPKRTYDRVSERGIIAFGDDAYYIGHAIAKGTVLPKGHGRLFILDEKVAKKYLTKFSFSLQDWISEVGISEATLKVIEADKDGE